MKQRSFTLIWLIVMMVIIGISASALAALFVNFPNVEKNLFQDYERLSSGIYRGIFLANNGGHTGTYYITLTDDPDNVQITISISYATDYTITSSLPNGRKATVHYTNTTISWN